jgi:hypothetical protein
VLHIPPISFFLIRWTEYYLVRRQMALHETEVDF